MDQILKLLPLRTQRRFIFLDGIPLRTSQINLMNNLLPHNTGRILNITPAKRSRYIDTTTTTTASITPLIHHSHIGPFQTINIKITSQSTTMAPSNTNTPKRQLLLTSIHKTPHMIRHHKLNNLIKEILNSPTSLTTSSSQSQSQAINYSTQLCLITLPLQAITEFIIQSITIFPIFLHQCFIRVTDTATHLVTTGQCFIFLTFTG
mmetsp:Transcript_60654/g.69287  ORF Transcript_60654/g.69287 Transcript_60654/m.69287 type:complete len:206 (+) Transcript_60654:67-684(+)